MKRGSVWGVSAKQTCDSSAYQDIDNNFMLQTSLQYLGDDRSLFQRDFAPVLNVKTTRMREFDVEELGWCAQSNYPN